MLLYKSPFWFVLTLGFLASVQGRASVNRISSVYKDLSKVEKIYLHAGLISVVEFPDPVLEVRIGNTKAFRVEISQISPRELSVYLLRSEAQPSNLIVRSNQKIYVFDVIPSTATHQDYIKVSGSYSAAKITQTQKPEVKAQPIQYKSKNVIKIGGQ